MRATAMIEVKAQSIDSSKHAINLLPNIACHFGRGGTTGVNRKRGGGGGVVDNKAFTLLQIHIPTRQWFSNEHATK